MWLVSAFKLFLLKYFDHVCKDLVARPKVTRISGFFQVYNFFFFNFKNVILRMCFSGTSVMSSVSLSVVPLLCFTSGAVGSLTSLLGGGWKSLGKLGADWDGSF